MTINADRLRLINSGHMCDLCGQSISSNPLLKAQRIMVRGEVKVRHYTCPTADMIVGRGTRVRLSAPFTYRGSPERGLGVAIGDEGVVREVMDTGLYYVHWERRGMKYYVDGSCLEVVPEPVVTAPVGSVVTFEVGQRIRLVSPQTCDGVIEELFPIGTEGEVLEMRPNGLIRARWDTEYGSRTYYVDPPCVMPVTVAPVAPPPSFEAGQRVRMSTNMTCHGRPERLVVIGREGVVRSVERSGLVYVDWDPHAGRGHDWYYCDPDNLSLVVAPMPAPIEWERDLLEPITPSEHITRPLRREQRRDRLGRFTRLAEGMAVRVDGGTGRLANQRRTGLWHICWDDGSCSDDIRSDEVEVIE